MIPCYCPAALALLAEADAATGDGDVDNGGDGGVDSHDPDRAELRAAGGCCSASGSHGSCGAPLRVGRRRRR